MSIGKNKFECMLLSVVIFISVISQIEPIIGTMRPIVFMLWGIVFVSFGVMNFSEIKLRGFSLFFICLYVVYLAYCVFRSFYDPIYLKSNFLTVLISPLLITVIGDFYRPAVSYKDIRRLMIVFVLSALVYAMYVQITYFPSLSAWIGNLEYAFPSKNSAAQIWGSAVIMIMALLRFKNKYMQVGFYAIGAYLIFLCFISQCRTAILGMFLAYGWYMFKNKTNRIYLILFTALLLIFAVINWDSISDYLYKALFLGAQDDLDANKLSSGRLDYYREAIEQFAAAPLLGVGSYYVDNHYLCVLTESGLFGFLLVESIWAVRIILNLRYHGADNIRLFLVAITLFYFVESLFEAFPPFGPGTCAMAFWLLSNLFQDIKE